MLPRVSYKVPIMLMPLVTPPGCVQERKDPWKDLSAIIMEEKYKAEERREIIGEEWRKISRILDKFLLMVMDRANYRAN